MTHIDTAMSVSQNVFDHFENRFSVAPEVGSLMWTQTFHKLLERSLNVLVHSMLFFPDL